MATLTQYLELRDGVSAPLKKMIQAAQNLQRKADSAAASSQRLEVNLDGIGRAALRATPGLESLASVGTSALSRLQSAGEGVMRSINNLKNSINSNINKAIGSTIGQFSLGNIIGDVVLRGVDAAKEQLADLVHTSDEFSGIQARLNLVTGSQEKAIELNEQIYQSALRARGQYDVMADSVSKIAMTAKEAFPDPNTVVPFMENVQKLFAIGGTDAEHQADALLQLTQALGSGKLQGDELRSIAEAAPMLEQVIAEYMGVSIGDIKQLGAEGKITADIIKNAMLGATDEINKKFEKIPLTWENVWTNIATQTTWAFRPVYEQINKIANSDAVKMLARGFVAAASIAAIAISNVISIVMALGENIYNIGAYIGEWLVAAVQIGIEAFQVLATIGIGAFTGLVSAAVLYGTYLAIVNIQTIALAAQQIISAGAAFVMSAASTALSVALRAVSVFASLTSARLAILTAITWALSNPILLIIALVGVVVAAFTAWRIGTVGLGNTISSVFGTIAEVVARCVNFMIDKINTLIGVLNTLAGGINKIFGTNISDIGKIEYKADPQAWGEMARNFSLNDLMPNVDMPDMSDISSKYQLNVGDIPAMSDAGGIGDAAGNMRDTAGNTKATADNTKAMLDAMDIMDEDLKFFRDVAEQEVINKYTTASVDIKVENQNNISSDVDADGMIVHLIDQLGEAMSAGAEAVHP